LLKNGHYRGGVFATRHTSTSSAPFTRATRVRAPDQQIWGRACASMSSCKNTPPKSCKKNRISNTTSPLETKRGGCHAYHLGVLTPKGEFKIDHPDRFTEAEWPRKGLKGPKRPEAGGPSRGMLNRARKSARECISWKSACTPQNSTRSPEAKSLW